MLVNVIGDAEVGISDGNDEIFKGSLAHIIATIGTIAYLTPNGKRAFTQFKKAFTKAPILPPFDLECHI